VTSTSVTRNTAVTRETVPLRAWSVLLHQLRSRIRHDATVLRDGRQATVDVTTLVPGGIIELRLGDIVPADVRLLEVSGLECGESVLTGESLTVDKSRGAVVPGTPLAELAGCAPPAPPTSEAQMD